jgi:membrane protein DedA with SNARE-associated domain
MLTEMLGDLGSFCKNTIDFLGYPGVCVLMALESMIAPIPSELVMPFAGFLVADKGWSFSLVILFSTFGSIIGSLLSYYIGYYGGNPFVLKFGKYLLLDEDDLMKTEQWFSKRGDSTVFISRFIPVVRHLISIPAGIGRMNMKKFCVYTIIGATAWNTFLALFGYVLGREWDRVQKYMHYVSVPVAILLGVAFAYFAWRHIVHKLHKRKKAQ